jgi:hypothetical protein
MMIRKLTVMEVIVIVSCGVECTARNMSSTGVHQPSQPSQYVQERAVGLEAAPIKFRGPRARNYAMR